MNYIILSQTTTLSNTNGFVLIDSTIDSPIITLTGFPLAGDQLQFNNLGPFKATIIDTNNTSYVLTTTGSKLVIGFDSNEWIVLNKINIQIPYDNLQTSFLTPNPTDNGHYGNSISLSSDGTMLAVGAPRENNDAGRVYVYTKIGALWNLSATLNSSNSAYVHQYGISVCFNADGSRLIVGANQGVPSANSVIGLTYVYVMSPTGWFMEEELDVSKFDSGRTFGTSVALDATATRAVVSAPAADGTVYVFKRSNGWNLEATLTSSTPVSTGTFGTVISINAAGDIIAIGAPTETDSNSNTIGRVHLFYRNGITWTEKQSVISANPINAGKFGESVKLNAIGNKLIVGGRGETVGSVTGAGRAYIFSYDNNADSWLLESILAAIQPQQSASFGKAVEFNADGTVAVVSAFEQDNTSQSPNGGSIFVYTKINNNWCLSKNFYPSDTAINARFGFDASASADGSTLIVSAYSKKVLNVTAAGGIYIYN